MRRIIFILGLIIFLHSCGEKVDQPIAEYTWPVVHSFLNFEDSVHFLRLGKTFSGPDVHAMINNPDSLYFSEAYVYFDIYNGEYITNTIQLELTNEFSRLPGLFPEKPCPIYMTDYDIQPGWIGLRIDIPELDHYAAKKFYVRGKPYFYHPEQGKKKELNFYDKMPVRIYWDAGDIPETTVRLRYLEITENGRDTCNLDWTRGKQDFILWPNDWLNFMLYWIKDDYRVLGRRVIGVDILAKSGIGYKAKQGEAFDLIAKPYSNIVGAYGIIASWAEGGIYDYMPNRKFLDSLSYLPRMERLKFIHN